jgi:hypothetical protein
MARDGSLSLAMVPIAAGRGNPPSRCCAGDVPVPAASMMIRILMSPSRHALVLG